MSIIKGIDRIALVLAFIAVVPGFWFGFDFYERDIKSILSLEYRIWLDQKREASKRIEERIRAGLTGIWANGGIIITEEELLKEIPPEPKNKHPFPQSAFFNVLTGLISTALSFAIVLYGIRYGVRAVRFISLWIYEGFKE